MSRAVLVDSHVLLWILAGDPRLTERSRQVLTGAERVHVSGITMLELSMKELLGRLTLPSDLAATITAQGMLHAPFDADDAAALRLLPAALVRHDPFDRALLGQALRRDWDLVTADERLLALGLPWVLDARTGRATGPSGPA